MGLVVTLTWHMAFLSSPISQKPVLVFLPMAVTWTESTTRRCLSSLTFSMSWLSTTPFLLVFWPLSLGGSMSPTGCVLWLPTTCHLLHFVLFVPALLYVVFDYYVFTFS